MNKTNLVLGLLALTLSFACGDDKKTDKRTDGKMDHIVVQKDNESDFEFTVGTHESILISAKTQSCQEEAEGRVDSYSIGSKYFNFFNPQFNWRGSAQDKVEILALHAQIDSSSQNSIEPYQCTISGEDLKYLFYKQNHAGQMQLWNPSLITKDSGTDFYTSRGYTSCPLRCGGVISKNDTTGTAPAHIIVDYAVHHTLGDGTDSISIHQKRVDVKISQLF